jgi:heat shock protein HslJ
VSDASALVGPRWRLVEANGQAALPDTGQGQPYLQFESGRRMGGNTTCNSMGGNYEASGSSLRFSDITSTMRACVEEARMQQEARFVDALQKTDRYAVRGDTLELMQGATVVARLVKG